VLIMQLRFKVWLLFVISIFAYIYMVASYEKPVCKSTLYAVDVPRWLGTHRQPVIYEDGDWVDGFGRLIGTSMTEDSDVCIK